MAETSVAVVITVLIFCAQNTIQY